MTKNITFNLKEVDINSTCITISNHYFIKNFDHLLQFEKLDSLIIHDIHLTQKELNIIFQKKTLTMLSLCNCNIFNIKGISQLENLIVLMLGYNNISIIKDIEKLNFLQYLRLDNNNIQFFKFNSTSLSSLNISKNNIKRIKIKAENLIALEIDDKLTDLEFILYLNNLISLLIGNKLYEDNKLSILLDQINLKYRSLKLEELISSF